MLGSVPGIRHDRVAPVEETRLHWLVLPECLDQAWGSGASRISEILWGQYALFLTMRLQDDLLDGDDNDPAMALVAHRALLESLEAFSGLPRLGPSFWALYRRALSDTLDGMLEARFIETEPGRFATRDLEVHARVCGIFRIGTAAVCHMHRRARELRWLLPLLDALAVTCQIFDDLEDLPSDLERGRYTWVANTFLGLAPGEALTPSGRRRRPVEAFMGNQRLATVRDRLRHLAKKMVRIVPKRAPSPIHDLVRDLSARPDAVVQCLHEARVRWVFGDLVNVHN